MYGKLAFLIVMACLASGTQGRTRLEITNENKPTLDRLRQLFVQEYQTATADHASTDVQLKANIERAKNQTTVIINRIKTLVDQSKNFTNNTQVLTCIRTEESKINRIGVTGFNGCYVTANLTALGVAKAEANTQSNVALNTIAYCQNLYPFGRQNDGFDNCLQEKITDFNLELNHLYNNYQALTKEVLAYNENCINNVAKDLFSALSKINYDLTMCIFLV